MRTRVILVILLSGNNVEIYLTAHVLAGVFVRVHAVFAVGYT